MTPNPPIRKRRPAARDDPPTLPTAGPPARTVSRQPVHVRLHRIPRLRTVVGGGLGVAGLALFVAGNLGARTGAITIPGDPHHALSQIIGAAAAAIGLSVAAARSRPRH